MGNALSPCSAHGHEADMLLQSAKAGDQKNVLQTLQKHPELLGCKKSLLASKTVWHCAAKSGSSELLQALVDFALSEESPFAQLPLARRKVKLQAMLNVENAKAHTPLLIACSMGHSAAVAVLMSAGADVYIGDRAAETGLHFAARNGHADCIRVIMDNIPASQARREHYSLQDVPSLSGLTPLYFAVAFNHVDCVEVLLQRGAYLLARTKYFSSDLGIALAAGSSPLHVGAQLGRTDAVRVILKHQASSMTANSRLPDARWARNSDGFTPYQVACRRAQDVELVEMLHPLTDLGVIFNLQELVATGTGVAKLSFIAAAALQAKLLVDIKRVCSAGFVRGSTGMDHGVAPGGAGQSVPAFARHTVALGGGSLSSLPQHSRPRAASSSRLGAHHAGSGSGTAPVRKLQAVTDAAVECDACESAEPGPADSDAAGEGGPQAGAEPDVPDEPDVPETPEREGSALSQCLSPGDPDLDRVLSGGLCALCFERVPDVGVEGCEHKLCSQCAETMCSRVLNKPLTCPFCRKSIAGFIGTGL